MYKFILVFLFLFVSCKDDAKLTPPKVEDPTPLVDKEDFPELVFTYSDWPPYCVVDGMDEGVSVEVVKAAFEKEGLKIKTKQLKSWKEAYEDVTSQKAQGSIAWYKKVEREEDCYFSDPIHRVETVIFHRKSLNFDWENVKDLSAYNIQATELYMYGEAFHEAEESGQIKVQKNSTDLEGLRNLINGECDLFVCAYEVGQKLLKENFSPELRQTITAHSLPILSENVYLVMSKENPKNRVYIERFNRGLIALRSSGELADYSQNLNNLPIIHLGTGECAPYSRLTIQSGGFSTEFMEQVLALAGYSAKTDFYPWQRWEELLQRGGADLIFPYARTPKREEKYLFTEPIATTTASFYLKKGKYENFPQIKVLSDLVKLKDFKVVGLRGYYMNDYLLDAGIDVKMVNYLEQGLKLLESDRYDVGVFMDSEYFVLNKQKNGVQWEDKFELRKAPWWTKPMSALISKTRPEAKEFLEKVNLAIKKAKERKYLKKIVDRHEVSDQFR